MVAEEAFVGFLIRKKKRAKKKKKEEIFRKDIRKERKGRQKYISS